MKKDKDEKITSNDVGRKHWPTGFSLLEVLIRVYLCESVVTALRF